MPNIRHITFAMIVALLATLTVSGSVLASKPGPFGDVETVADPNVVCSPGQLPTGASFEDELHPPQSVRVLRSKGPNASRVETVTFRDYVAVVLRAEYSTGQDKPPLWMRVGAITVKQYAWFKAVFWQGGRVTLPDGTVQCFDVKDTTADQIYKPHQTGPDGTDYPGNEPTPANYKAVDETWHITVRKWVVAKNKSRLFLTGYRSGKQTPCGSDSTGFKIMQKSLRDCGVKNLNLMETVRKYFEPVLYVDTRDHDVLSDGGDWRGDLGLLADNGGDAQWRLYPGTSDSFGSPQTGSLGMSYSSIVSQGMGDMDGDNRADLMVLANGGSKVLTAKANGTGYAAPTATDVAGAAADRLLVADFDGDLLADAGLLRNDSGQVSLQVMRALATGGFAAAADWWTGTLDLANDTVLVGDANGDGKADLLIRNSVSGAYLVATSNASCTNFSAWGVCPADAVGGPGLGSAAPWLNPASINSGAKNVVGDYNRDGRDDVLAVVQAGSDVKVFGMKAKSDGTFADPLELFKLTGANLADFVPVAMDVNPDGMADLAMFTRDGTGSDVFWLRSVEQTTSPASMSQGSAPVGAGVTWSQRLRAF